MGPPMGGDPAAAQPQKTLPMTPTDVWGALEKVMDGGKDDKKEEKKPVEAPQTKHLNH